MPVRAETAGKFFVIKIFSMGKSEKQSMRALEYRTRSGEALARDARRVQPGVRRPAGVQALGPGALGEVFDDPARHAAGNAESVDCLFRI